MKKMQYVIKTCSSENTQELQNLLNEMSMKDWELYSMQETESENGEIFCHCIFMKEVETPNADGNSDVMNISSFKSRMEKMISPQMTPYETCLEIQRKIRERNAEISKIKKELEGEAPASVNRKKLNDKISAGLKELDELKKKLAEATSPDSIFSLLNEKKLSIMLSEEILAEQEAFEEELVAETVKLRMKLANELGYVIPKIVFSDDENLNPYEFSIKIRGMEIFKASVYPNHLMFFADELHLDSKYKNIEEDIDEITGKDIIWVEKSQAKDFWQKGISCSEFISRALKFCAVKYVDDLLSYDELEKYIDVVAKANEFLVTNIIPEYISMSDLKYILTSLIKERVSIKDITFIFEKINDYANENTKEDLVKKIRLSLSSHIYRKYQVDGVINAFEISRKTLDKFMLHQDEDAIIRIDAEMAEALAENLSDKIAKSGIETPILIAPLEFRHIIFTLLSNYLNDITVLSREEIGCHTDIKIISEI